MHFSTAVALLATVATQVTAAPLGDQQQLQPRFRVPKGVGSFRSVTARPILPRDVAADEEADEGAELQARKLSADMLRASYIPVKSPRPVRLSARDAAAPADEEADEEADESAELHARKLSTDMFRASYIPVKSSRPVRLSARDAAAPDEEQPVI